MQKRETLDRFKKKWTRCNIFIQNFTQQLQLRKAFNQLSLKWHSCITKVETFEFWDMRIKNWGLRVKNRECDMVLMYGDLHHPIIIKQMVGSMSSQLCHCQTPKHASMQTLEATKNWTATFSTSSTNWTPDTKEKAFMLNQRQIYAYKEDLNTLSNYPL